jgi:glycolate oxidase
LVKLFLSVDLKAELEEIVGEQWVIDGDDRLLYSYDAFTLVKGSPFLVVLPGTEEEAIAAVRHLLSRGVRFVVRGSGTSLSGSTVPTQGEVVVSMTRLSRIYEVKGMEITVGPGIANALVSRGCPSWLFYSPDPSSYVVSSIGGNISHDSGGIHVLKYGTTSNNVVSLRVLLPDGTVEEVGGTPFLDPSQIFVGAEGTLGVVLRATLKLTPKPPKRRTVMGVFKDVNSASRAVVGVFRVGVIPAAMEMMDRNSILVVEKSRYRAGYPECGAILLVELDGFGADEEVELVSKVIEGNGGEVRVPKGDEEEERLWKGRKGAFAAMGVISSAYLTLDSNIPRSKLPEVLEGVYRIASRYGLFVANVFHAGDGNLHPLIPYDPENKSSIQRALEASAEIVRLALRAGGVVSGEHGIGIEKLRFMEDYYSSSDLEIMERIKGNFDPNRLLNPCKLLPKLEGCKAKDENLRILYKRPLEVE